MKLKGITVIKNYGDLIIGKRSDDKSPYYYCRFYVTKNVTTSGYYRKSLKTRNHYDARRLAVDEWE